MQHFWVVGTDTDVGKTAVTTLLMRQFQRQNLRVTPFKPVQTGEVHENNHCYYYDTTVYEKYSLQVLRTESLNGYSFKEAASPHFAAQLEVRQCHAQCIQYVEEELHAHHEEMTAVIIEPLIQAAAGMKMYPPIYLKRLRELCTAYDVHLIADEIAVGFGRTGTLFACKQAQIAPDFYVLVKGFNRWLFTTIRSINH